MRVCIARSLTGLLALDMKIKDSKQDCFENEGEKHLVTSHIMSPSLVHGCN